MGKIKFSIPYNGDLQLMKEAVASGQVYEIYFAGPKNYNFSDPYVGWRCHPDQDIFELLDYCNENNIQLNFLLNKKNLFFEEIQTIERYINILQDNGGVNSLTISDPYIVPFFKEKFPGIKLQSSIFMDISNSFKAKQALCLGLDDICLAPALNRNFKELKKIMMLKKDWPKMTVKLLGIHGCYYHCLYLPLHPELPVLKETLKRGNFKTKGKFLGESVDFDSCSYPWENISDEIKRPFIRPEDISYYQSNGLADYIKIAYRNDSSQLLKSKIKAYFQRRWRGDLFKILNSNKHQKFTCDNTKIPKDFIKKVMNCNKDCRICSYCQEVAKKTIKIF